MDSKQFDRWSRETNPEPGASITVEWVSVNREISDDVTVSFLDQSSRLALVGNVSLISLHAKIRAFVGIFSFHRSSNASFGLSPAVASCSRWRLDTAWDISSLMLPLLLPIDPPKI
ncbi:hypothetical protein D0Y65_000867 [Glycine soja]|uniref:Uncharacterized protein n=1 Tax=Glycine soja TaxID=3848 RepID=A0A445M0N5_GLYSO|nr:hypothetical protein D0Y65_000867 [Glycine soja]